MKSLIAMLVAGSIFLPASAFAFTLEAGNEEMPVQTITINTDILNPDTDGEGFLDGVETGNGYDPTGDGTIFTIPDDIGTVAPGETQTFVVIADLNDGGSGEVIAVDFEKQAKLMAKIEKLEVKVQQITQKIEKIEAKIEKFVDKSAEKFANKITKLEEKLAKKQAHLEKISDKIASLQEKLDALGGGIFVTDAVLTGSGISVIQ